MAIKRKITRSKRKAQQPGMNPLLIALGAGAGAAGGRAATNTLANRNVTNRIAAQRAQMDGGMFTPEGKGTAAARLIAEAEYRNMPRVANKGKVAAYNDLMATEEKNGRQAGAYERSRRTAGLSKKEFDTLYAKKGAKVDLSLASMSGNSQRETTRQAVRLRADNTRKRNTRRGAVGGGAIAALAQAIINEMRKKP